MSQSKATIASVLKASGLSVTKARLLVFELLDSNLPLTMNELHKLTQNQIDRASLYRIVGLFEKLGIVNRINIGWKYKIELSDTFNVHHHHLSCLKCGKVINIKDEKHIDEFIKEVTSEAGFKPTQHHFEVEGYCRDCRKQLKRTT